MDLLADDLIVLLIIFYYSLQEGIKQLFGILASDLSTTNNSDHMQSKKMKIDHLKLFSVISKLRSDEVR